MATSISQRPPAANASTAAVAATRPEHGIGHRVGAEAGLSVAPGGQPPGDGGVVAEGHPVPAGAAAPVAGDRQPHLRPPGHQRGRVEAELLEGTGSGGLDHQVGPAQQVGQPARRPSGRSSGTRTLALPAFIRSKKAGGPSRAPSGRPTDSTLTTVAPPSARIRPHNGPAHSELRSTTSRPSSPRGGAEPCASASTGSAARGPSPDGGGVGEAGAGGQDADRQSQQSGPVARGRPPGAGATSRCDHAPRWRRRPSARPAARTGRRRSSQAGTSATSLAPGQRERDPAVGAAQQSGAAPAADRPAPGATRPARPARSAARPGRGATSRPSAAVAARQPLRHGGQAIDQTGRWTEPGALRPPGQRHRSAGGPGGDGVWARSHAWSSSRTLASRSSRCGASSGPSFSIWLPHPCAATSWADPRASCWWSAARAPRSRPPDRGRARPRPWLRSRWWWRSRRIRTRTRPRRRSPTSWPRADDLDAVVDHVTRSPIAATSLALLLRGGPGSLGGRRAGRRVGGLLDLAGRTGVRRLAARRVGPGPIDAGRGTVRVERIGSTSWWSRSDRPEARNALDAHMRDQLWDAFTMAAADPEPDRCAGAGPVRRSARAAISTSSDPGPIPPTPT